MNQLAVNSEERFNEFYEQGYFNIENGFPFQTSQQLFNVLYNEMFMGKQISRMPIISTPHGLFIQTQPSSTGKMNHTSLLELTDTNPDDINFATGIEEMSLMNKPTSKPYISVPFINPAGNQMTAYWTIKSDSDTYGKPFNADDLDTLRRIFENIEGVTFVS